MGQHLFSGLMWRLVIVACLLVAVRPTQAREADCRADQLVEMPSGSWAVISQVALTATRCPPRAEDLGRAFLFGQGDTVHIFLRLQGSLDLLDHIGPDDRLRIVLRRSSEQNDVLSETTYPLSLRRDQIGLAAARNEATLPERNGIFDWRFYARINAFYRPGRYSLTLSYGGRPLCQLDGACRVDFSVR